MIGAMLGFRFGVQHRHRAGQGTNVLEKAL
mgnify:FL=1